MNPISLSAATQALKTAGCPVQLIDLTPSAKCANTACLSVNTSPKDLLLCSGCRTRKYCSPACQKQAWKSHREECKGLTSLRQAEEKKTPAEKDYILHKAVLRKSFEPELSVAIRSALLLGKPQAMGASHCIAVYLIYIPPQSPVDQDDIVAVRKLFRFDKAEVLRDVDAPEPLKTHLMSLRTLAKHKQVYYATFFKFQDDSKKSYTPEVGSLGFEAAFDECHSWPPNPYWKLYLQKCLERDTWPVGDDERNVMIHTEDIVMYNSPEVTARYREDIIASNKLKVSLSASMEGDKEAIVREHNRIKEEKGDEAAFEWFKEVFKKRVDAHVGQAGK